MLEMIVDKKLLVVLMVIFAGVGVVDKCVAGMALKRLVEAAGDMSKSVHPLMRLVRAKFEHACMVSDTVENVGVFVDKYLYEYKIRGLRLHTIRRMEKICAGLCILTGLTGAFLTYRLYGMVDAVLRIGAGGVGLGILVWLCHLITDEEYCLQVTKNYMVDYLENVCLHRYEKNNGKDRIGRQRITGNDMEKTTEPAENLIVADEPVVETMAQAEIKREVKRKEPNRETARNLEKATAKLAEATKVREINKDGEETQSKTQKASTDEVPDIPENISKELPKEEMIRQILQEFMA